MIGGAAGDAPNGGGGRPPGRNFTRAPIDRKDAGAFLSRPRGEIDGRGGIVNRGCNGNGRGMIVPEPRFNLRAANTPIDVVLIYF